MAEHVFVTQADIDRLKELEAKGAPAPWSLVESHGELRIESEAGIIARVNNYIERGRNGRTEGELACRSRNLLPSLLKERNAMQERIRQLEEALRVSTDPPPKDGWESLIPDLREAASRKGYEGGYVDAWYSCEMAEWLLAKLAPLEEGQKDGR